MALPAIMMEDRDAKIKQRLDEALQLPGDQRREFLRKSCGEDPQLLKELVELLDHAEATEDSSRPDAFHGADAIQPSFGSTSSGLIAAVKKQNSTAWQRLVNVYGPLVFYWCNKAGLNNADSADVLQEIFVSVVKGIEDFDREQETHSFRAWLRTISHNEIVNFFRKASKQPVSVGGSDHAQFLSQFTENFDAPSESQFGSRTAAVIRAAHLIRNDVSDQTWQAFWRTAIDEQMASDVASELEMTPTAVRKAKSRVIRKIRDEFADLFT